MNRSLEMRSKVRETAAADPVLACLSRFPVLVFEIIKGSDSKNQRRSQVGTKLPYAERNTKIQFLQREKGDTNSLTVIIYGILGLFKMLFSVHNARGQSVNPL